MKKTKNMKRFLVGCLGGFIGMFLFLILFVLFVSYFVGKLMKEDKTVLTSKGNVLHIVFDNEITEKSSYFDVLSIKNLKIKRKLGLFEIIKNIKKAEKDTNIKAIFLEFKIFNAGYATLEEIRKALKEFKINSKKPIVSYAEFYTQKAYYLASVSDVIYLNPVGLVEFKGLNAEFLFYKKLLESIGIETFVFRHGKYKSAAEQFTNDSLSPENEMQIKELLNSIWNEIISNISYDRNINEIKLQNIADSLYTFNSMYAKNFYLVDSLKYFSQVINDIKIIANVKDVNLIDITDYERVAIKEKISKDKIALIILDEALISGTNEKGLGEASNFINVIREIEKDKDVKAVVLRVNSPGGSAIAAESMLYEIKRLKEKIPVIVSFGDVAASGGYYISCYADYIFANKNTITGSIGVIGMLFNVNKFFKEKLYITRDVVKTNKFSDFSTGFRNTSDYEKKVFEEALNKIYQIFLYHVSVGRKLQVSYVDSIGQGRIWSGINAIEKGLVDEIGGLYDAIEFAKQKANIEQTPKIKIYPKEDLLFQFFFSLEESNVYFMPKRLKTLLNLFSKKENYIWALSPIIEVN